MAATQEALDDLVQWQNTMNGHFEQLDGIIRNNTNAWFDLYHNPEITNETVENRLDWMDVIRLQHPEHVSREEEHLFKEARKYIMLNGHKARCFDKGIGKNRHQPLFKAFVTMRDVMNRVTGYKPPPKKKPDDDPTQFQRLFDIED
jgi:hypothetical protein